MAKRSMPLKEEPVRDLKPKVAAKKEQINLVVANCQHLNVRNQPSLDGKVLYIIPQGTNVVVDGMQDEWFHIHLLNDEKKIGYVMAQFVKEI